MRTISISKLKPYLTEPSLEKWPVRANERFLCTFDDGVVLEVTTPRIDLSRWLWDIPIFYNKMVIKSSYYISDTHLPWNGISKLLSNIYKDLWDCYDDLEVDKEEVWKIMYRGINNLYNYSIQEYKPYVRGLSALDYTEVYEHPTMVEIRKNLRPNAKSIERAYESSTTFLRENKELSNNTVVSDIRSGITSPEQLNQCIIARGFTTDIDDHIYPTPIMSNYYAGLHDPVESTLDSTLASKSIIYTGSPLEQTQYGNRKLQLSSVRIDLLITGDCNTPLSAEIPINEDRVEGLLYLNYLDPNTNQVKLFTREVAGQYMDQTLNFRVPMYCGYRHKASICTTCYGDLHRSVPYGTNLGHIGSTNTQSAVSQLVLKVKHVESLTDIEHLQLNPGEEHYLKLDKDPLIIKLNPNLKKDNIKLLLLGSVKDKINNASRLYMMTPEEIEKSENVSHLSQFIEVTFELPEDAARPIRYRVNTAKGSMPSSLSKEFLLWFMSEDRSMEPDGFYHIDLSTWDFDLPFLELPRKQMSMRDFSQEVEAFIRSTGDDSSRNLGRLRKLTQYTNPDHAMVDLFDLISSKLFVPMNHVSVLCLSMMVDIDSKLDMNLMPIDRPTKFTKYADLLKYGSFGALAAYQSAKDELQKATQYLTTDRPQHLLDPLWKY